MYERHFGLNESPFRITPDPRFLYMSRRHREAFAHLVYGLTEGGGFVQLTGDVGTGKTTLSRHLLSSLDDAVDVSIVLNPSRTPEELLASICDELGVEPPQRWAEQPAPAPRRVRATTVEALDAPDVQSQPHEGALGTQAPRWSMRQPRWASSERKALLDALNHHLLAAYAAGRRTVLVIDEAQCLGHEVVEQIRLLTNLETETTKLLQIILIGQPELASLLARQDMRQVAQRITARYHLSPLGRTETADYIRHRLAVAGSQRPLFSARAMASVYALTGGVPRLINVLCDRALLGAYAQNRDRVTASVVRRAAAETLPAARGRRASRRHPHAQAIALALLVAGLGLPSVPDQAIPPPLGSPGAQTAAASMTATGDDALATHAMAEATDASVPPARPDADADPPADATGSAAANVPAGEAGLVEPAPETPGPTDARTESRRRAAEPAPDPGAPNRPEPAWPQSMDAALAGLFEQWAVRYADLPGTLPCQRARAAGLRCADGQWPPAALERDEAGAIERITRFNRPLIVEVVDPERGRGMALITAVDRGGNRLRIQGPEGADMVPVADFLDLLTGAYLFLWRSPVDGDRLLRRGAQGPEVQWVKAALRASGHLPDSTPPQAASAARFDDRVESAVRAFQSDRGLVSDGLVGSNTLLHLQGFSPAEDAPVLDINPQRVAR